MYYEIKGRSEETGRPVTVQLGWDDDAYYFGIFDGDVEINGKSDVRSLPELWWHTSAYLTWTRQVYQAVRDLPCSDYVDKHPAGDPFSHWLHTVRY